MLGVILVKVLFQYKAGILNLNTVYWSIILSESNAFIGEIQHFKP